MTLFPLSAEMLNLWKGIIGQLLLTPFFLSQLILKTSHSFYVLLSVLTFSDAVDG